MAKEKKLKKKSDLIKILPYYKKYKKLWAWQLTCLVLISVVGLFVPILSANILASIAEFNFSSVLVFLVILSLCRVVRTILNYFEFLLYEKVSRHVTLSLSYDLINSITKTTMSQCDETNTGVFIERMNADVGRCSDSLLNTLNVALDVLANFAFFIYIAFLNIWFFLLMTAYVGISYLIDSKKEKVWWNDWKEIKKKREISSGAFSEQIRALRDIKSLNIRENSIKDSTGKLDDALQLGLKAHKKRRLYVLLKNFVLLILDVAFILLGIILLKDGLALSLFLIVYTYSGNVKNLSNYIASIKESINQGEISATRVFEVIDQFPKESFGSLNKDFTECTLTFSDVTFSYNGEKDVLKNLSLDFEPHKITAIVGKSGGGKSTILSLSNKLYTIKNGNGKIFINETDINELTEDSLRNCISTVTQSPYIFNTTIKENMKFIKSDATDEEIYAVLKKAQIDDYVASLKDGLESKLGENGIMLSGGQKQRFALARVLLKNPPVIILDEATSALDNKNQQKIVDVINDLKKDHTIVIVAHRLSTIVDADKIIVIDDGQKVAEGIHKKLIKCCSIYKELYEQEELATKSTIIDD